MSREAGKDWETVEVVGLQILSSCVFLVIALSIGNYALPLVVLGWLLPPLWLRTERDRYHTCIQRELPAVIDVLIIAAEAGLGLGNSLQTVVEQAKPGAAVRELTVLLTELTIGKKRSQALKDMADRVNQPDLRAFALAMNQAHSLGTSSAKVLRVLAFQMRTKRSQRAEAAALKAPVKMVFPLVFFIFPTLLLVFFGPVFLRGGLY